LPRRSARRAGSGRGVLDRLVLGRVGGGRRGVLGRGLGRLGAELARLESGEVGGGLGRVLGAVGDLGVVLVHLVGQRLGGGDLLGGGALDLDGLAELGERGLALRAQFGVCDVLELGVQVLHGGGSSVTESMFGPL
jgi:hypothetical protein